MKNTNSELRTEFKDYLQWNWWNVENLENTVKRFGLDIFDVFFDWILGMKKNNRSKKQAFLYISNNIKDIDNTNYLKVKTYKSLENLFIKFVDFCENNKEIFNSLFLEKYWSKFENKLTWEGKNFIEKWHNYIINDKWENKDKFCGYLFDIYEKLGLYDFDNLVKFYHCLYQAHRKLSQVTSRNKETWKKDNAFNIAFEYLCKKLTELNLSDQEWKVKSLFGKYLNFVPKFREELSQNLWENFDKTKQVAQNTEKSVVSNFSIEWNYWIEWDWYWPIVVKKEVRDPNIWYYDEIERGDIIAPIDFWIFYDDTDTQNWWDNWESISEEVKTTSRKKIHRKRRWNPNQWEFKFED